MSRLFIGTAPIGRVVLGGLILLILVIAIILGVDRQPGDDVAEGPVTTTASPADEPALSSTNGPEQEDLPGGDTPESEQPSPELGSETEATAEVSEAELEAARQTAERAIYVYGSFPNGEGAEAWIAQLRPLATERYIEDMEKIYLGNPLVATATIQVTEVYFEEDSTNASNNEITFLALVTRQHDHVNAPDKTTVLPFIVTLEKQDDRWLVSNIEEV